MLTVRSHDKRPHRRCKAFGRLFFTAEDNAATIDQIRSLYDSQPFQPFIIHLADGRQIPVEHRQFMALAPSGHTVGVYGKDDTAQIIDLLLITDLKLKPAKNGARKRRSQ